MADYCRILIIDDEFIMRQGLKHMLDWERQGFEIVGEASNGKEGLELIAGCNPHIVLCDIVMPQMDGVDFSKMVQSVYPEVQIIILSSYDNFEYVKGALQSGAVDYVLKPTLNPQELLEILKRAAKKIPGLTLIQEDRVSLEKSLERYLLGSEKELAGPEVVERFPYTFYRLFGISIHQSNRKGQNISGILYDKIIESMKELKNCTFVSALIREDILCLVLNFRAGDREEIYEYMEKLTLQLTAFHNRIYGVLSSEFSTRSMIKSIYEEEILPNMGKAFYCQRIHLYMPQKTESCSPLLKLDYNRFSGYLNEKRFKDAIELLYDYIFDAVRGRMEEYRLKNQIKNMLDNILDSTDLEREQKEEIRYGIFKKIDQTIYEKEFISVLEEIKQELYLNLESGLEEDYRIRQILSYISDNYNQDLDLNDIAKVFSFNYYYLSAYFNQHMEEGFSEYLNRIRIEQSCRILKEKEMSIAQVSSEVGYSDPSYYCRVFKKVTGDTPSAWRRSHRQTR